ncbi:MAG: TetR/AcrR family transcriptional regulator [Oscillospiraceae bacterium]|nr:TetR/AcrR family transcriptional regulator [Oscillospiraceae bacterium]
MDIRNHRSATASGRRQLQIENCLFENLLHTPYQSLSVSDLCRQVGISRKAFYNYYRDKEDCFCSLISRYIQDSLLHVATQISDNATTLEAATALLEFWRDRRDFLDVVIRNNLMHLLLLQNMRHVLEEDRTTLELLNTPDMKSDTDILACYMTSQLTLVLQWYYRDFDTPAVEMAKKLLRVIHAPLIPL